MPTKHHAHRDFIALAGFVHSSAALTVGPVHAGLNLYNNGFAAGIVAAVLVPVITAIQAITRPERGPPAETGDKAAGRN